MTRLMRGSMAVLTLAAWLAGCGATVDPEVTRRQAIADAIEAARPDVVADAIYVQSDDLDPSVINVRLKPGVPEEVGPLVACVVASPLMEQAGILETVGVTVWDNSGTRALGDQGGCTGG